MTTEKISFNKFLEFFPEIELPIHLTEDVFEELRKVNSDLPVPLIQHYILELDKDVDEFTEFFPCFRIPGTDEFVAVVYWKAKLMQYEFHLVTYSPKGEFIAGRVIGQTISNGTSIIRSVATIDEDWIIQVVTGEAKIQDTEYDASSSKAHTLEILSTGDIIFSLNEDLYEE